MAIEPQFQRLLTPQGFVDAFWEMLSYYQNHEEAYNAVERQHNAQFGKNKYASFESFRICRDKLLNKADPVPVTVKSKQVRKKRTAKTKRHGKT